MNRDELAFKILLAILQSDSLRQSIVTNVSAVGSTPADLFARVAWVQADAFIAAGITDEMRQRAAEFNVKLPPGSDSGWKA